jgi:hypothetical protein
MINLRKSVIIGFILITLIVFIIGCSSSSGPDDEPSKLTLAPDTLAFDSTLTLLTFNIDNTGSDAANWTVGDNRDWISAEPLAGSITTETDQVNVTINRSGQTAGNYSGAVTVTSGSGVDDVVITMTVPVSQTLAVSHTKLIFRTHLTDLFFYITNAGQETLTWNITENLDWLTLSPLTGTSTTENDTVFASADRTGMEPGDYSGNITISSDGGNFDILVLMTVPEIFKNGFVYFPIADGDIWYYTWVDSNKTVKRQVSGDTVINSITCVRILENDTTAEAWTKDASGFYVHLLAKAFWFEPPLAIPFDLEEGITYNFSSNMFTRIDGNIYTSVISGALDFEGYITKTVPAGQFNDVIKLFYQPNDEVSYYEYYAPGVGLLDNGDYILDSAYIGGIWYRGNR